MKWLIILAIFLITPRCDALDISLVTFNYHEPGTMRIKYTGIKKAIMNEARDFLEDEWRNDAQIYLNNGQISFSQYNLSLRHLAHVRTLYGLRGRWWQRPWFKNLPPNKGGAPPERTYTVGRQGDLIDLGFAKINENFKFRFKEYKKQITKDWNFKFSPRFTGNTTDIISKASGLFTLTYYARRRKRFRIIFEIGYKKSLQEFIEFRIEILNL